MQLKIVFAAEEGKLVLPMHYQQMLQGLIYHSLNEKEFQTFLHDQGFAFEKRRLKMFTFSRLFGKFQINAAKKQIIFHGPVISYRNSFTISDKHF